MPANFSQQFHDIISGIGEDPQREGLQKTPERAAKAFTFLTQGYQMNLEELVNGAVFKSDTDEMVIVHNIEFYSMCEHHMLPFFGHAHIAYIPSGKVLGLSKFARITDMFARRLQIQEQLTRQVALAVEEVTEAQGVGVVIQAQHLCMMMRGVEKQNSVTTTSVMLGSLRNSPTSRAEFLNLIGNRT